ncbi:MAG: DUF4115 domain-containing protein, partial [Acidimicrobiales bacterium]
MEAEVLAVTRDAVAVAAVGAGVIVIGAVVLVAMLRRRGPTESNAVSSYRGTLETLGRVHGGNPQAADGGFTPRRAERSLAAMDHRSRHWAVPAAVVVLVLAAAGGLAYVGTHRTPAKPHADSGYRATHDAGHHRNHGHTTTVTAPSNYSPVASTASSATFAPDKTNYSLTIAATSGECWVSVTSSTGATLLEETMAAGTSKSVSTSGRTTVVLGAPTAAALSIDGVPATLPAGVVGPFTVT